MCVCQGEWQLEKYLMIALKLITTICLPPCVSLSRPLLLLLSYLLLLMLPAGQPPRECHTQQQQQHKGEEEEEAEENAQGQQQ